MDIFYLLIDNAKAQYFITPYSPLIYMYKTQFSVSIWPLIWVSWTLGGQFAEQGA